MGEGGGGEWDEGKGDGWRGEYGKGARTIRRRGRVG